MTSGHGEGTAAPWRIWIPETSLHDVTESEVHVLLWQIRGMAHVDVAGSRRSLSVGHALWVPVGTRHGFTVHENSVTMPLFFESADTATTLSSPTLVPVDRDLRTLMLAHSVSSTTRVRPEANLARQILALIEERPVVATDLPLPRTPAARTIADALRFNPGDIRSIDQLAESVHVSTRTIERVFRQETGMTLRRWRIHNRMEAAAILLRSDAIPEAVAHRVGYTNVNSFRRVFTGQFGLSPTQYARRYRAQ